jgi:hypothetical protein
MKFKQYLQLIADPSGFVPTPHFHWEIRQNPRPTAREEAIAASVIEQANPRENITGHFPWGPEQQMVLRQLWIHPGREAVEWRDIEIEGAEKLFSYVSTEYGDLPVPDAVKEPGVVKGDFQQRIKEAISQPERRAR